MISFIDKVLGQTEACRILSNSIASNRIPHALLLSGPPAVGKYFCARMFAAELLFDNLLPEKEQQRNRNSLLDGSYPDLHIIPDDPAKKQLAVKDVRALLEALSLHSYYGKKKVAIIQEAHRLSLAASNALLLSLEEPADETFFILTSSASHRLLPTIISRCQTIPFLTLKKDSIKQILNNLFSDKLEISLINELSIILNQSLSGLQAINFIDPISLQIREKSDYVDYLKQLNQTALNFRKSLQRGLTSGPNQERALLQFSRMFTDSKHEDYQSFFWASLRSEIQTQLRHATPPQATRWAKILEASIDTEQMILERNAQKELQTLSFLYSICEVKQ